MPSSRLDTPPFIKKKAVSSKRNILSLGNEPLRLMIRTRRQKSAVLKKKLRGDLSEASSRIDFLDAVDEIMKGNAVKVTHWRKSIADIRNSIFEKGKKVLKKNYSPETLIDLFEKLDTRMTRIIRVTNKVIGDVQIEKDRNDSFAKKYKNVVNVLIPDFVSETLAELNDVTRNIQLENAARNLEKRSSGFAGAIKDVQVGQKHAPSRKTHQKRRTKGENSDPLPITRKLSDANNLFRLHKHTPTTDLKTLFARKRKEK